MQGGMLGLFAFVGMPVVLCRRRYERARRARRRAGDAAALVIFAVRRARPRFSTRAGVVVW